jgi:putative transposase
VNLTPFLAVDPAELEAIRPHVQRQHAYGPGRFRRAIEAQLGRSAGPQKIGRPRMVDAIE